MARVSVAQKDGEIVVFDGEKSTRYAVKDGVIVVSTDHLAGVLASVPGSELAAPEAPAKKET
jgi:hypothetical protein